MNYFIGRDHAEPYAAAGDGAKPSSYVQKYSYSEIVISTSLKKEKWSEMPANAQLLHSRNGTFQMQFPGVVSVHFAATGFCLSF